MYDKNTLAKCLVEEFGGRSPDVDVSREERPSYESGVFQYLRDLFKASMDASCGTSVGGKPNGPLSFYNGDGSVYYLGFWSFVEKDTWFKELMPTQDNFCVLYYIDKNSAEYVFTFLLSNDDELHFFMETEEVALDNWQDRSVEKSAANIIHALSDKKINPFHHSLFEQVKCDHVNVLKPKVS